MSGRLLHSSVSRLCCWSRVISVEGLFMKKLGLRTRHDYCTAHGRSGGMRRAGERQARYQSWHTANFCRRILGLTYSSIFIEELKEAARRIRTS